MESTESKKTKDRSPSFPFITLERALERARQFYNEEKRGAAPYTRAVMHWGYTEASSGGLQTIAALRSYGLMEDVGGSGKARQLKLSELALRILLDQRPESDERLRFIREAATEPNIASDVFVRWPDGLPSDSTLNHFLVLERKFNEASALTAVKILKENQRFAQLDGAKVESPDEDSIEDKDSKLKVVDMNAARTEVLERREPPPPPGKAPPKLALRYKGVAISIEFSEEPTREVFEYLERYAGFEKTNAPTMAEVIAKEAGGATEPS